MYELELKNDKSKRIFAYDMHDQPLLKWLGVP